MAKNWNAYEAAKELYGVNKENIKDICKRYPLFARLVCLENSIYLLDLLKALPRITCKIAEAGLANMEDNEDNVTNPDTAAEETEADDFDDEDDEAADDTDYESMNVKDLYKLCCDRGISSRCKKRDKKSLIKVLTDYDNEQAGGEDEEQEEDENPYKGKTARELYKMCVDRKIKAAPRKKAEEYAKLLMKADEEAKKKASKSKKEAEEDDWGDDDDDWEI